VSRVVTTRPKLLAAAFRASSWLCAYTDIVNAAPACPGHAVITAIGTWRKCISVAQECRA
jgi:hypothetical protein